MQAVLSSSTYFPMIPELLAPAGTVPAFEAALDAGADAVYLGVPAFNARALARDFSFAELAAMIDFAHERGRRVHPAMNSLVKEGELPQALAALERVAAMEPDALIVQDPALARAARRRFPELPLHASTLMTAHNSLGVRFLAGRGFRRVVLGRELSLAEIGRIAETARAAGVELEVFIHGAMCFCYSGLCRFSSLHGGKSSLRGQCVQPCRRRYQWVVDGKAGGGKNGGYLFSMNDLDGLGQVAALAELGVACLKIEGRLKSVAYVRAVTRAYRLALDALSADEARRAEMLREARAFLAESMGRRSASGFFAPGAASGPALISPGQSGASGAPVGTLIGWDKRQGRGGANPPGLLVRLTADIRQGDRLRLHEETSDARIAFTLRDFQVKGRACRTARAGETVSIRVGGPDFAAWRTPHSGRLSGGIYRVDVSGRQERVGPELARLIARLQADPQIARPLLSSEPDDTSRQAGRGKAKRREIRWWLRVASLQDLRLRPPFRVARWLVDLTRDNLDQALTARRSAREAPLIWVLPAIIPEERITWYAEALARLREAGYISFQLGQAAQLELFAGRDNLELFGDASMNPLNHETLAALFALGFRGLQFSLESDRETLASALAAIGPKAGAVGLYGFGRPALFTARAESPHFKGRHALESPRGERYVVRKREQGLTVHPQLPFSLLAHAGELAELGLGYLVIDLCGGHPPKELALAAALMRERPGKGGIPHFTGNYGGVLA